MNNYSISILLVIMSMGIHLVISDECSESIDSPIEECVDTEYESYIECVRKRFKRQAPCGGYSGSCDSCNCNQCSSNNCNSQCNTCCANFEQPCETKYCCYKTCHSQCNNQGCRDTCRRSCAEKLTEKIIVSPPSPPVVQQTPNITTIINLHNKINNTNIIDVPINLKTDNINNITVNTNGQNGTGNSQCCQVVSPRQCSPTTEFPFMRCYHLRKRTCGDLCTSNIMHAQPHQICDQTPNGPPTCHNQITYIPQPQPRCVYKPDWPYVSCNIPRANCEGCYDHYSNNVQRPPNCPNSCYDDGFGVGPYYRQAPFYRPGYAPVPSCMQLGTCPPYYPGYGFPMGGMDQMYGAPNQMYGAPNQMYGALNQVPVPLSGVGYPPSTYDNFFTVQKNLEVPDLTSSLIPGPVQGEMSKNPQPMPLPKETGYLDPLLEGSSGVQAHEPMVRFQRNENQIAKEESPEKEMKSSDSIADDSQENSTKQTTATKSTKTKVTGKPLKLS